MNKPLGVSLLLALLVLGGCDDQTQSTNDAQKVNTNALSVSTNAAPQATETKKNKVVNADLAVGKALHDQNCISCHDTGMYTRAERKISDFPSLLAQVRRCDANLETALFDEDIEQIANYLNQAFYHFK